MWKCVPISHIGQEQVKYLETNSLFVSREQPIGSMTTPLISASPGEPDAGRQTESPHSGCRPSRITPCSSQKSLTTLIDVMTQNRIASFSFALLLSNTRRYYTSKFICSSWPRLSSRPPRRVSASRQAKLAKLAKLNNNASLAYPLRQWA
jgi:hypothetical protein